MPPNNNKPPGAKIADIYREHQHAPPLEVKMDFPSVSTIDEGSSLNPNSPAQEEAERSVAQKFRDFADLTTAHGAKRVLIARTRCSKLFWLLLMFALYGMVIYVVIKLTGKYTQHDRITSISIKFDEVEFPAITFCNLNPYKRSLVRLIPSIRDTMDVYDNAKSQGKVRKEKKPKFSRKQHIEMSEALVKELFREELEEEEARLSNITDASPASIPPASTRRKRMASGELHQIYEAIEAHCRCLGKLDMECIRFESPPKNDNSKCICTLNMDLDKAWPCFNSTIWYDHMCPVCSVQGTCDADYEDDVPLPDMMIRSTPDFYGDQAEGFPCVCRARSHYEGTNGDEKPYCVRKHSPVEIRRLWVAETPPTTTAPPPNAPSDHVQRPIVTNPETIKAMGFAGMTDGVAMLTKAKENIMFTMAAMSLEQRVALSQAKREFIEMCSFNGKECDIDKQHVDPEFGNCYTFNYDPKNNLSSSRAGPMYGIRVLLFVNTSDYMSTSESAGIRLAIHPATQYPFPNTFGYSAPVGFASSFGIKKVTQHGLRTRISRSAQLASHDHSGSHDLVPDVMTSRIPPQLRLASRVICQRGVKEPVVNRVKDFADRTTAHGAKHVLEARTTFGRVSWLTLIIVLLCVVVLVVFMLVDKYSRHDTITLISIKFDEADFPAVTFCNLNPYKKSLISLIPSVKDTMDVFDNARSSSKAKNENSLKSRRSQLIEMRARRVKELFKSEFENDATYKSNAITTNRLTRNKRQFRPPSQVYEAIEAHCLCLGYGTIICVLSVQRKVYARRNQAQKPYCIRKARNTRRLWEMVDAPEKMAVVAKEVPKPPTTTVPPRATPVSQVSKKTKIRSQRPIVSEPETISAMGFAEMSDGVAMLTQARQNLMFTMAALSREQRIALSQDLDEFIEMCSFDGKDCDIQRDFKLHVDPEFGNCYTFNYDRTRNLSSSRSGPMYGIRVLLFVNSSDYISTTESTGVRLAIHPASQYPFPATFGYSAPVGFASSFGIKKLKIERLTGYGDCAENVQWAQSAANNIYGAYEYNPEGCHRSCFQNRMLEDCDCGDPRFPVPQGQRHCSAFNATARRYLESKIGKGDLHHVSAWASDCDCKHPCKEVVYSMAFSTSKWPSGSTDQLGDCEGMSPSECEVFYRKNAAMVEVYYEQLNYELLQESEAYGIVNLIADFGGHLGLWLGFSVITIVEVLALIVDLVQACFRRRQERKRSEILMKNAV